LDNFANHAASVYLGQPLVDTLAVENVQASKGANLITLNELVLANSALYYLLDFLLFLLLTLIKSRYGEIF